MVSLTPSKMTGGYLNDDEKAIVETVEDAYGAKAPPVIDESHGYISQLMRFN